VYFLKRVICCSVLFIFLSGFSINIYAINAPSGINVDQRGQDVTLSWGSVSDADSYTLYWAPWPGGTPINSYGMELSTNLSVHIGTCEAYYVAVTASKTVTVPVIDPATGEQLIEVDPSTGEETPVWKKKKLESAYSGIGVVKSVNPSFFPIRTCGGALADNSWEFLLNEGNILIDSSKQFGPGDIKLGPGNIWIDTSTVQFVKTSSGTYVRDGIDVGSHSADNYYDLVLSPGNDAFGNKISEVYVDQFIKDMGIGLSGQVEVTAIIQDSPINPISFPLTRTDLHTLSVGTVIGSSKHSATKSSIDVSITQPIVDNRYLDTEIDFNSTWTLIGKMNSMTVLGNAYYNIAVVENVISGQYIGLNGEVEEQNRFITYWLSRGVGMVKSTGAFLVDEKPLLVELENYTVQD
jgi:hypothetical protein